MKQEQEFYIGWQAEMPSGTARMVRRYVYAVVTAAAAAIALLTIGQRGFSNGVFEYGKTTELEGYLTLSPAPFLTIERGKDAAGKPVFHKILLVAPGKFGFQPAEPIAPEGRRARVGGFLVYNDGKAALQVERVEYGAGHLPPSHPTPAPSAGAPIILRGEIADPKCLLGVMNPGAGKPHRDCAVRCIAGGIPPILRVANKNGEAEYYLLAGPSGERLNERVLDFVGDGVQMSGRIEQQDNWFLFYTDPATFQRINKGALDAWPMCW